MVVADRHGERASFAGEGPAQMLHFRGLVDCQISVLDGKVAKVTIERCRDCRFSLAPGVRNTTSTLELIASTEIEVDVANEASARIVTIDGCAGVQLQLPERWGAGLTDKILAAGSARVVVNDEWALELTGADGAVAAAHEQFVAFATRGADGSGPQVFVTERAMREGVGHVTRRGIHEEAEERRKRNIDLLVERTLRENAAARASAAAPKSEAAHASAAAPDAAAASTSVAASGAASSVSASEPLPGAPSLPSPPAPPRSPPAVGLHAAAASEPISTLTAAPTSGSSLADELARACRGTLRPTVTVERTLESMLGRTGFGLADGADLREYRDTDAALAEKIAQIARAIGERTGPVVVFTGAGISTAAKLPDYRGPNGVWTLADRAHATIEPTLPPMQLDQAEPTLAHRGLAALVRAGVVAHVVSTNVDGLHLKSGVPASHLSELHGNAFAERCARCARTYARSYDATKQGTRRDHRTGRQCEAPACDGELLDTIVNFGETLPQAEFASAHAASSGAAIALVLGTSLSVQPACLLPELVGAREGGQVFVVNRQRIAGWDERAAVRVFADCDEVVSGVCAALGVAL